ncbi:MAG TPA: DUF2721 domain-containing protein [Cytophagaceae bacterium]|jgi:hypothetical protein|nr:DUF2721 domain-containing protein [Cytophagaceae bacterium]
MELSLTTPALLFPTISLLMLAYTNRFIAIGNRIRVLHVEHKQRPSETIVRQIKTFRRRVRLIRDLQLCGIVCLFANVFTMLLIFSKYNLVATYVFGFSLVLMMVAFAMSALEIILSTKALYIQIEDLEKEEAKLDS